MTTQTRDAVTGIAHRRWARRLRAWRRWLVDAAVLAAVAAVAWIVLISSWLGVHTVLVKGTGATPDAAVVRAAAIAAGTPLARVDLTHVRARVEAIPTVASASVTRSWPNTIVVQVAERRPVATVFRDGSWRLLDSTGVIYLTTPARDPALPVVELDGLPGPQTLPQLAAVLKALPPDLLSRTGRLRAASMDSITLLLKDGRQVQWGSAAESAQKAAVLAVLLHGKAQAIDVSVPSHPATRP